MGELKKVSVKIQGREYVVNSTEDIEHIQKIAYYVDKKLDQVMSANPSLDILRASTLVSLNLADSLFKAVNTVEKMRGKNGIKPDDEVYNEIEKLEKEGIPNNKGTEKS